MASADTTPRPDSAATAERQPPIIDVQATMFEAPATDAPTPEAAKSRATGGKKLGLVSALAGLGALSSLGFYTWTTMQGVDDNLAQLKNSVGALAPRIEANEKSATAASKAPELIAALEKRLLELEQKPAAPTVSPATVDALAQRLGALEQRSAPQPPVTADALAALEGRIATMEASARTGAGALANLPTLERRLAAVEAAAHAATPVDANAPPPPPPPPQIDLAPIESRLVALDQRLAPLEARLAALDGRLKPLEAAHYAPKVDIRAPQSPEARPSREADAAALAVVAQSILRAVERGDAFFAEIAAAETLGAEAAKLAPLKAVAREGAVSAQKLALAFRPLTRAILDSDASPKGETAGVLDQLTSAASKLVRVRPAGEARGEEVPALVAQIESALQRGAITQAIAAWDKLPEPARKASASWAIAAKQRAVAEAAAQLLLATTMMELGRKRSAP